VPKNLAWIAIAALVFFGALAMCLSSLSNVITLRREDAFLLDIVLSIVFFQLLARRVIAWRSVAQSDPSS
jgi:hypothetical protein